MKHPLHSSIKALPQIPGVYLFKNKANEIIYIGKAKNLRSRCNSYLTPERTSLKTVRLMEEAVEIEHIPLETELAAALLEARLIQQHKPHYNILLKDGQPFVYFLITKTPLPRLELVRTQKAKGEYFGPFLERTQAQSLHRFLLKTFQLKLCSYRQATGCLAYHMNLCAGKCLGDGFDETGYLQRLEMVKDLLRSGNKKMLAQLDDQMAQCNEELRFEESKVLYRYKTHLANFFAQRASLLEATRAQAMRDAIHVWVLHNQRLTLFSERHLSFKKLHEFIVDNESSYDGYLESYYRSRPPAYTIIANAIASNPDLIESFLTSWWELPTPPSIIIAPSGHNDRIHALALLKAQELGERKDRSAYILQKLLKLPHPAHTIDCFDISHKQGHHIVGSSVRFTDGAPDTAMCRHFKIKTLNQQNDYAALQEVAQRRYKNDNEYPNLILVDGGKGQLGAVRAVIPHATCVSIAKREERIFGPNLPPDGLKLDQKSVGGKTLIALRDYAHHFAISYHRKLANRPME